MSLDVGLNSLKIEETGEYAYVPYDDLAKLMYYLNCVFTVLQINEDKKFIDFKHYMDLTQEEQKHVFFLAVLFSPDILIEKGVFLENPDLLDYGDNNKFLKLTDERIGIHVDQEIFVGERYVKVLEVMVCNKKWLNRNYYEPKERTKNLLKYKKYGSENGCCSKSNGKIIFCSIFIIFYLILFVKRLLS